MFLRVIHNNATRKRKELFIFLKQVFNLKFLQNFFKFSGPIAHETPYFSIKMVDGLAK